MRVSVFGLGYVGAVSAACLANEGHTVVGVDPIDTKVDLINDGKTPIIEEKIGDILESVVKKGLLTATSETQAAITATELSFVCVGTPSQPNGNLDFSYIRRVCKEIGTCIADKDDYHVVVIRSTILPGTMRDIVIPILEESSGKKAGTGFGICNNPEFLREGTAVYDFYNPPKTVIGEIDSKSGDLLATLYAKMDAPLIRTDIATAEMVKYVDNVWHALKVTFGNEVGNICKSLEIDGHKVMDIFCQDLKLNLSPYYLKPGFAFGGSCLPKDVRALSYKAKELDLDLPIISAILPSNQLQVDKSRQIVMSKGKKKIGILGFSFKAGTDDLRESPVVELIESLLGKGYDIRIFDRNVNVASLIGANRDFILNQIPHISKLMAEEISEVLDHAEVIVIGNKDQEFVEALQNVRSDQIVVDLVRISENPITKAEYDGICW